MEQYCACGWTLEYLQREEQELKELLAQWRETDHPFRTAGIAGAQAALASVQSHLAEVNRR